MKPSVISVMIYSIIKTVHLIVLNTTKWIVLFISIFKSEIY